MIILSIGVPQINLMIKPDRFGDTMGDCLQIYVMIFQIYHGANKTVFVKLEELHIATARKPLIHQNQPIARFLHKKQPCMLWVMLVGLQHRTLSSKLSTDNQVIGNFCIPADSTNAFGDLSVHTNFRLLYSGLFFSMLRGAK